MVLSRGDPSPCRTYPGCNSCQSRYPMTESLAEKAISLSKKRGLSGYDATYAALAEEI